MSKETKTFKIDFYTVQVGADDRPKILKKYLKNHISGPFKSIELAGFGYQIRELSITNKHFRGVLGKYRSSDVPHISAPGKEEKDIPLAEDEGLLEKNHFLYYPKIRLLIFQVNGHGSHPTRLEKYLSILLGVTTTLNPVLQVDAVKRLMQNNVKPKKLEISFSRPTNPELYDGDNFDDNMMKLLSRVGGNNIRLTISAGRENTLKSKVKAIVADLKDDIELSVARFQVEEDGSSHPIDLIADRLRAWATVEMIGRYPSSRDMYSSLESAYDQNKTQLDSIFGPDGNSLQ